MRSSHRIGVVVVHVCALICALAATTAAQPVKNRISVMVDSSGSMLMTPEIVTFPESCVSLGWNGCNATNSNPSPAQESCNACMTWTVRVDSFCAGTWDSLCRDRYAACWRAFTGAPAPQCGQVIGLSDGIPTRGDGSSLTPGCDVDGDGQANDSRMYQAKEAIQDVIATFGEVEFSLWRYAQIEGGQTCSTSAQCPDTPGGLSVHTCQNVGGTNRCAVNSSILDVNASTAGQCDPFTWNGAPSTFSCASCFASTSNIESAVCDAYGLGQIRTGGTSPLGAVSCASASHPFILEHGGFNNAGACDPTGGERLVDFPATGFADNYAQIFSFIDHQRPALGTDVEITAQGGTPIAASLRDMRAAILANATADTRTPCRKHQVVFLTDGGESCESVANAVSAAGTFQNMSFTNAAGVFVADYDVPVYIIGFAICPPGNQNCQTRQDLNAIAAAGGTGQAILVNNQLELQLALAQIVAGSVVSERCNNLDDDCDTLVDEDFPGKGSACSVGVGACFRSGQIVCTGDQLGLECNATPGAPSPEICNGIDDNCDGLIDNGINCTGCVPVCSNAAGCDICNNIDEDCDGLIDEDFSSQPCGLTTGACSPGATACNGGVVSCQGGQGPVLEVCNNADDDCDGFVDGMTQPCYPAATAGCDPMTGVCQGICRLGTETCTLGVYGTCTGAVTPGVEIACNGIDEDCDGFDATGGPEQCNGLDDDCDGLIDEGVDLTDPDIGQSCGTPPFDGICRPGTIQCVAGAQQCVGEIDPQPETCNNLDDDCNGTVDDGAIPGFGGPCGSSTGRCEPGTLQCVSGGPQCVGQVGPFAEICNGLDDNCNGTTDETDPAIGTTCQDLPGGGTVMTETGECRFGVRICDAGGLVCVGAVGPTAELCDGRDNDCDGMTDEDFPTLGQACDNGQQGVCRQTGVVVCAPGGLGVTCTAPPGSPGTETCNNIDDDCDGEIDEDPLPLVGEICAPAVGVCQPGRWECVNGALTCPPPTSGNPEVCNGVDDDCDALVDETPPPLPGEEEACVPPGFEMYGDTGECEFGQTRCVAGGFECEGYVGPSPEICDGLDNDCDGDVDDQATCPSAENVCFAGECVNPCGNTEFPCPVDYVCQDLPGPPPGRYCVPDPCRGVTCTGNEVCDSSTGECRDLCANVTCRPGEECRLGFCLDCFDLPANCDAGELCVADAMGVGQCVDNPCDPNPCGPGQTCSNGECSSDCAAGCPNGQLCVGGVCEVDLCDDVRCPDGQVCDPDTGNCRGDQCGFTSCLPGQVCVPTTGECISDPCLTTTCPEGNVCVVDGGGRPVCGVPGAIDPERVTAAGGGCACDGGGGGGPPWLALGLLALLWRRRRPAPARGGPARAAAGGGR
ncbi:MAG: hypothetical protein KJZ91_16875 [Myxococcales bacterium]|nr:hypothetical protein [Myxococcales bacterium]